jgi:hypothetical protein
MAVPGSGMSSFNTLYVMAIVYVNKRSRPGTFKKSYSIVDEAVLCS